MSTVYLDIHKDIIEQCKEGNSRAFYQLYQLYSKAMFNVCLRMLGNWQEAEDMLQEAFVEAFKNLNSFRYESTFGAWLKQVIINKCINFLKKKKVDLISSENVMVYEKPELEEGTNEEDIEYSVQKIHKALELLPEGYRVIFSLYALEGYDHVEISQILDISEGTSKSQYLRAKKRLKEIIKNDLKWTTN